MSLLFPMLIVIAIFGGIYIFRKKLANKVADKLEKYDKTEVTAFTPRERVRRERPARTSDALRDAKSIRNSDRRR